MPNGARVLFQSFVKKGLSEREAFFAVMDHQASLHNFDCEMYSKIAKEQDRVIRRLEDRLAALESR